MEYTMTQLKRYHVIKNAIEGICTVAEAAVYLNLSSRRIKQLKKEVKLSGALALIHGNKGRKPSNALSETKKEEIIALKKSYAYEQANFSHFRDLLLENGISISYSTLYKILSEAGLKSRRGQRNPNKHRMRKRKEASGMMLQADGTPFDWFNTGKRQSLHGFIDDATGSVTGLYMCENECLLGYLEVTRQTLKNFGIPLSLYPDRLSVFFSPKHGQVHIPIEDQLEGTDRVNTQFGRIMDELGVKMFPAHSPQAKGRIERLWNTLQDRLVTEFRIAHISDMQGANAFFPKFIKRYNKQFSVKPADSKSAFVPMLRTVNLDTLLAVKVTRRTDNAGVFSVSNIKFEIKDKKVPPRAKIQLLISHKCGLKALYNGNTYRVFPCSYVGGPITSGAFTAKATQEIIFKYFYKNAKAS